VVTRQKGQQIQKKIVDAANRLFYQRGYNRTSFSDIAAAADIPRGNFYYHFKSKQEILSAVIESRMASIRVMLEQWQQQIGSPRERLKRYVQILVNEEQDVLRYGCPMGSLNMELAKNQLALQSQAAAMFDLFLVWLQQQFEELGMAGQSRSLALRLLSETQGTALLSNVFKDKAFLEQEADRLRNWIDHLQVN
jgi:AcrR family transcriptional regulator